MIGSIGGDSEAVLEYCRISAKALQFASRRPWPHAVQQTDLCACTQQTVSTITMGGVVGI
jgi:hypothetical protein